MNPQEIKKDRLTDQQKEDYKPIAKLFAKYLKSHGIDISREMLNAMIVSLDIVEILQDREVKP